VLGDRRRDVHEHPITGLMAERVVDDLELVDVDERQRQGCPVMERRLDLGRESLAEPTVVEHAGGRSVSASASRRAVLPGSSPISNAPASCPSRRRIT
jgi:hypothetical protein